MGAAVLIVVSNLILWILTDQSTGRPTSTPYSSYRCPLLTIPNGRMFYLPRAAKAGVTCRPGFTTLGSRDMTCLGGEWVGEKPECVHLPSSVESPRTTIGDERTIEYDRFRPEVKIYVEFLTGSVEPTERAAPDADVRRPRDDAEPVRAAPDGRSFAIVGAVACALIAAAALVVSAVIRRYECVARIRTPDDPHSRLDGSVDDVVYTAGDETVKFVPKTDAKRADRPS